MKSAPEPVPVVVRGVLETVKAEVVDAMMAIAKLKREVRMMDVYYCMYCMELCCGGWSYCTMNYLEYNNSENEQFCVVTDGCVCVCVVIG
mmetsp:Transcript_16401/g.24588  ORF Transcript_16401/g.24588 Transcript_16401/m.24588 type:complete len:90 (-) Transcript_16401:44-313(-)